MARRRLTAWSRAAVLFALVLGVAACTPETRYNTLSFFFDGVPPPGGSVEEKQRVSSQYLRDTPGSPVRLKPDMRQHAPYKAGACTQCHPKDLSFALDEGFDKRGRCFGCHEHEAFKEKLGKLAFVHGPVAVGNCLVCHDAHESIHPALTIEREPKLCYACHEKTLLARAPAHQGSDASRCGACHDPHGGADRFFLRGAR